MFDQTTVYGDCFHVYRTAADRLRLSGVALAGVQPTGLVRLGIKAIAPAGNLTPEELNAWLDELRRQGVTAELLPPDGLG